MCLDLALSAFLLVALLVLIIVVFVLWRRGLVFQKEGTTVNKQLHRMSRALTTVRHTVRRGHGDSAFSVRCLFTVARFRGRRGEGGVRVVGWVDGGGEG